MFPTAPFYNSTPQRASGAPAGAGLMPASLNPHPRHQMPQPMGYYAPSAQAPPMAPDLGNPVATATQPRSAMPPTASAAAAFWRSGGYTAYSSQPQQAMPAFAPPLPGYGSRSAAYPGYSPGPFNGESNPYMSVTGKAYPQAAGFPGYATAQFANPVYAAAYSAAPARAGYMPQAAAAYMREGPAAHMHGRMAYPSPLPTSTGIVEKRKRVISEDTAMDLDGNPGSPTTSGHVATVASTKGSIRPTHVNPRQFKRMVARRAARSRQGTVMRASHQTSQSRSKLASSRPRDNRGRFAPQAASPSPSEGATGKMPSSPSSSSTSKGLYDKGEDVSSSSMCGSDVRSAAAKLLEVGAGMGRPVSPSSDMEMEEE